ncbi:hypothetical protein Tco_0743718 [Tanacetum coccineum]
MLCYLTGMEPNYIQCINNGPFQPKTAKGANKLEAQWSNDERMVIPQFLADHRERRFCSGGGVADSVDVVSAVSVMLDEHQLML